MECQICLRNEEEGFEIVRLSAGLYLCHDCYEIHAELEGDMSYVDEAMYDLALEGDDDED